MILLDTDLLVDDLHDFRHRRDLDLSYTASLLRRFVAFVSAYLATNRPNKIVIIAMTCDGCHHVFETPTAKGRDNSPSGIQSHFEAANRKLCQEMIGRLLDIASEQERLQNVQSSNVADSFLAAGISMAVCLCSRLALEYAEYAPFKSGRLLCMRRSSKSLLGQYVSATNAIFSAERLGIPIDSVVYGKNDSAVLQQAAAITCGTYYRTGDYRKMGQYLLSMACLELSNRGSLLLTKESVDDLVASCFCHQKSIRSGYVCSTCVSVFCAGEVMCPTCASTSGCGI